METTRYPKTAPATKPEPMPTPTPRTERPTTSANTSPAMPFGRNNYVLMLIGVAVILAGFFIMSLDKEEFGFGFLGLTLGPLVVMAGFVLEFVAILSRPKH